jgi:hypothetical protein
MLAQILREMTARTSKRLMSAGPDATKEISRDGC